MSAKMLNPAHEKTTWNERVISARAAARYIDLADNTFFKALEAGIFIPQAKIEGDPRPSYGFETDYLDEIKAAIPSRGNRVGGQTIFTPEIRVKLEAIKRKWEKRSKK